MEELLIGTTDRTILVFIPDPASTTGAGKTGLVAAAITVTYTRVETDNDVVNSDVTSSMNDLSALTDAHNDWGWKEVSSTLSKGLYRLDLADAVFASGAWYAVVQVTITSGTAAATPKAFKLVNLDMFGTPATNLATSGTNYSATRGLSGTALPAAAADAAGGLIISDAGGLDADAQLVTKVNDILTDTAEIGTAGAGLTNINLPNQTMDIIGNITGNLSGTVGSVTGAVGSIAAGGIAAASFAAGAIDAAALAADAGTEIGVAVWASATRTLTGTQTFSNTGTWTGNIVGVLSTLTTYTGNTLQTGDTFALANGANGFVATKAVADAVKVKTDSLTFTTAGFVDANVQYVNDVEVDGTGTAIDPWGPV